MSEWQKLALGELIERGQADLQTGPFGTMLNSSEYVPSGIPVIAVQDIGNNRLIHDKFVFVNEATAKRLERYRVKNGDIIFGRKGAVDRRAIVNKFEEGWLQGSDCIRLRLNDAIDSRFVSYQFGSDFYKEWMFQQAGGATMPSLNQQILKLLPITLPPIAEQEAITAVLASLDDKIDLLHRQNKTLESMAQTLFRHWFIAGAADDWEIVTVGDFTQLNASSIQRDYEHSQIEYLDTGSITEGKIAGFQQHPLQDAPSRAKRLVKYNDVLYSTVRPNQKHYGIIKNPQPNLVVSTGFCVITCDRIDPHFVYLLLTQPDMTEFLHSVAEGSTSTYPSLKPSDIARIEFQLPPSEKLDAFAKLANDSWAKIDHNHAQIRTLEKLRDTLLPKLMSGEVRVRL